MKFSIELKKMQKDNTPIIIYGAGNTADTLLEFFEKEYPNLNIIGCAVSDDAVEDRNLRNFPVKNISCYTDFEERVTIFIAVVDKYIPEIARELGCLGFANVVSLSFESKNWEELREEYVAKLFELGGMPYLRIHNLFTEKAIKTNERLNLEVYMACCHVDKPLVNDFLIRDTEYLIPIQVGKALTDKNVAVANDYTGKNISQKNQSYSELTALYWIWRNVEADWVGLCHYRRHFDLSVDELEQISKSDVDIVLTTPILNFPSVTEVYYRDHEKRDWEDMLSVIKNMYPQYEEVAKKFFSGNIYCGYNMFIAKKNVIDDYCKWLFPLLERIEECHSSHETVYQSRYIGFLAERLFSLYFMSGINYHRIAFAHKQFYM